jgi:hypothetical protein
LHVWGFSVGVRVYDPQLKKLDPRTVNGISLAVENSNGFRFYCPSQTPRIVEAINAKCIEGLNMCGSNVPTKIDWEETQNSDTTSMNKNTLIVFQENQHDFLGEQSNSRTTTTSRRTYQCGACSSTSR